MEPVGRTSESARRASDLAGRASEGLRSSWKGLGLVEKPGGKPSEPAG